MRKKFMAGAAILALLMNSPQVKAEDDVVVFGGEFEDEASQTVSPPEESAQIEPQESLPIQPEDDDNLGDKLIFDDLTNLPEQKPLEQPQEELPQEEPEPLAQIEPQESLPIQTEDDDNLGDKLIFDDLTNLPEQKPLEQPQEELPQKIEEPPQPEPPAQPEIENLSSTEYEQPFEQPQAISNDWQGRVDEPVSIVPPMPIATVEEVPPPVVSVEERSDFPSQQVQPQQKLKMLKQRFIKLAIDDTYTYYLDRNAVEWKKLPYSSSEYMADVWIRMVEREPKRLDGDMANYGEENFKAQIDLAREQGYQYPPEDINVLSRQDYILEHYYLRPKTRQVQFLCELEVFGRPQNTINERAYDYKNWENLVPGSVESMIYDTAITVLGKSKGSERGHMTFIDMLEEYGRISLR